MTQLLCPVCQQTLANNNSQLVCDNGHSFDRAKQGYYNLLLSQQKKSKAPGDTLEMVQARQRFLSANFYKTISDAINQSVIRHLFCAQEVPLSYLDIGCGEGYYTHNLHQYLNQHMRASTTGLDISKEAVRYACKRNKDITWLVASGVNTPMENQSIDLITCLFTRLMPEEFNRLLNSSGLLVIASTGDQHLIELRQQVYAEIKPNTFAPNKVLEEYFEPIADAYKNISYSISIDTNNLIHDLVLMTPHTWRINQTAREKLESLQQLSVTIDVDINIYQPKQI